MTVRWARLSEELLDRVTQRITNEIEGIAWVCYDILSKPPAIVGWERLLTTDNYVEYSVLRTFGECGQFSIWTCTR